MVTQYGDEHHIPEKDKVNKYGTISLTVLPHRSYVGYG